MTITKVLNNLKEDRVTKNHLQGPDEARQKTNIKAIQSQRALITHHHRVIQLVRQMYSKEERTNC
jgi:hypothetical protein